MEEPQEEQRAGELGDKQRGEVVREPQTDGLLQIRLPRGQHHKAVHRDPQEERTGRSLSVDKEQGGGSCNLRRLEI